MDTKVTKAVTKTTPPTSNIQTISNKKIELKLKKEYENIGGVEPKRTGVRSYISLAEIKTNFVKAIYDFHLEYLFDNTAEELTEIIRRVDKRNGLTDEDDYKTRPLRGVASGNSNDDIYDVLNP